ncbi:MAG: AbrB/MazE/SpoVT family DNA-binding domain-containing protein [Betaproteobacteria bacterium]|nr:AbrB/MazE/SpoVT family DNA-binding domain-containing protein [Betaproteobacteria bacterium]NBS45649.1 AbrB/MazE/SpoVT family DNA-binding domain-containing protein [Betaproteobacteria bacterium]
MSTTLTVKGQVTIPKPIRDALGLRAGAKLDFAVNDEGQIVLRQAPTGRRPRDRFERARGKADVAWRTDELMALLRSDTP